MTVQADPYSRFYWRFRDEYPDIYADKETFGWWMTLLANAEGAHPSAAELPRRIKPRCLSILIDAELVEPLPGERYRLKGVSAEMERRSKQGKAGADARWQRPQSDRTASGMRTHNERTANAMPKRDETRRAETKQDETSNAPAGAEKHGSKNETDEERYTRYLALRDDPSKSADIRAAADHAVKVYEAQHRVN